MRRSAHDLDDEIDGWYIKYPYPAYFPFH